MELLVTLSNPNNLKKVLSSGVNGVIVGSLFSLDFDYSVKELIQIVKILEDHGIKKYCMLDQIISEEDKTDLFHYIELIKLLKFDGIYFNDLAIYDIACDYGLKDKLIYEGSTILCNSLDAAYILSKDIDGALLSRELTLEEYKRILKNNPNQLDMQIFGRFKMSYSKRRFLSDYFEEINKEYNVDYKNTLSIEEELRNYKMPIRQGIFGSVIYTDYIFEMYEELIELAPYIKRGIVSDVLIDSDMLIKVLRDYKHLTKDNLSFLKQSLIDNVPESLLSKGYLYTPTNKEKVDE